MVAIKLIILCQCQRCITLQEAHGQLAAAEQSFEQLELLRRLVFLFVSFFYLTKFISSENKIHIFYSKLQSMADPLKEKTVRLNDLLCQILSRTSFTRNMIDSAFLLSWEKKQHKEMNEKISPLLDSLEAITSNIDSFQQCLVMTKPRQLQFDKEKMNTFGLIKKSQHFDPQIDYDKLLEWFENAMPDLINAIYYKPPWSVSKLMEESQILDRLIARADDLPDRIDALVKDLHGWQIPRNTIPQSKNAMLSYLNEKLILTPTIDCVAKKTRRIAIWEAMPAIDSPITIKRNAVKTTEGRMFFFLNFSLMLIDKHIESSNHHKFNFFKF